MSPLSVTDSEMGYFKLGGWGVEKEIGNRGSSNFVIYG
jgi:hypothetical protein